MKIKITLLLFTIVQFSFFGKIQSQTMQWDEKYAETVFKDGFQGSSLDINKWNVAKFKRDIGLLIDSSATIKVNNGKLELTMISCPNCKVTNSNGTTYYGNYAGGEVSSKVPPFQYGIFECKAKYATNLGSWPAFWIIGGDGTPCPPGGYGNEIDIAELKCQTWLTKMGHVIHRYYPPIICSESNSQVKDLDIYNIQLNNIYYNYKCIWTPNKISYYINNSLMHEVQNTGQEWYPSLHLDVILSQQIITASNISGQFTVVTPQTTYFDSVSVKRFFATPVITCSNLICTSTTATLGVDPAALDITWSLTPTNLFSGAKTGTGKTSTITAASGASGQGKITYTFKMPSNETFTAEKTFWVGSPDYTKLDVNTSNSGGSHVIMACDYTRADAQYDGGSGNAIDIDGYEWDIPNSSNWDIYEEYGGGGIDMRYVEIDYWEDPPPSTEVIKIRAYNTCGWSSWKSITVDVDDNCGWYLMFTPNPTSDETSLSIESSTVGKKFDENTEWELDIYDSFQSLKEKKTKLKGKEHKIQTTGWKEGIYMIRAKYKNNIIQGKLVVKK